MSASIDREGDGGVAASSHHRRIATGFLWVSLFVLVGKFAGAAKEMALAWRYGVSATVDAYVLILNVINWPVAVWFSVLTVVLVPLVARVRNENPAGLPRFGGELLGLSLAAGTVLALGVAAAGPAMLTLAGGDMSIVSRREAEAMLGPLSPLLPLGLVISAISAWTMALGKHRNTLLEAVPSLVLLAVLLAPVGAIPAALVWGTLAGVVAHAACLGWPLWRDRSLGRPVLALSSPSWRYFWGGIGIMVVGQALTSFTGIVDQFFASSLGTGSVSVLGYASRLITLLLGVGALAISRATLPVFSEMNAGRGGSGVHRLALYWTWVMFALGVLAAALTWLLAPWGVQLLFERGAFGASDTLQVAGLLRQLAVQMPFYFASLVLIAYFAACGRYRVIAASGAANLVVKALALYFLSDRFGLAGLAASSVAMYAFSFALLLAAARPGGAAR